MPQSDRNAQLHDILSKLAEAAADPQLREQIEGMLADSQTGDTFTVGDIDHATGVAIGSNIFQVINTHTFPDQLVHDLRRLLNDVQRSHARIESVPGQRLNVMLSSTARDLPEHRQQVMDGCLRQGMFPIMMEHLPASPEDAITASLSMVDQADIYVGIYGWRYGYIPAGYDVSVTEMEYNRAKERGIPRLIFIMHDDHPVQAAELEHGEGAQKLQAFKTRVLLENIVNFFVSPADLRAHVINSLSSYRQANLTQFHNISDIPRPAKPYIAHPYTLLQSGGLIGREAEQQQLAMWLAGQNPYAGKPILCVVAIGGMGKSALTWNWFSHAESPHLAGRLWWSFYESDATFENFVIRALAYTTGRPRAEIEQIPYGEREEQLLNSLSAKAFLLVLDGLERQMIAYSGADGARLNDAQVSDHYQLRKMADPRVGTFLRRLAGVRASRILISTRLFPADLEDKYTHDPLGGCAMIPLTGLGGQDALALWRSFGVTGSADELLPLFESVGNHPLVLKALAGEIRTDRRAAGDFSRWKAQHKGFDPVSSTQVQEAMVHTLEFALRGIDEAAMKVLHTIAAFRMPASYDTLAALLVGIDAHFPSEMALDTALSELEERGLLGWDRQANRYDLHPIVRGVTWNRLAGGQRAEVFQSLERHFMNIPDGAAWQIATLDELTPAIELYHTLINLGRFDEALGLFYDKLDKPTLYRLVAGRQRVELLEMLFPDGLENSSLTRAGSRMNALVALGNAYYMTGSSAKSIRCFSLALEAAEGQRFDKRQIALTLSNLAGVYRVAGQLYDAEVTMKQAIALSREIDFPDHEGYNLSWLGLTFLLRGALDECQQVLQRAEKLRQYMPYDCQATYCIHTQEYAKAVEWAEKAHDFATRSSYQPGVISAVRLKATALLHMGELPQAKQGLHTALIESRATLLVREEIPTLISLAEIARQEGQINDARSTLDEALGQSEQGPHRLHTADAYNTLARVELAQGNRSEAVGAAHEAYRASWLDGAPYAYPLGLAKAQAVLAELGAEIPSLPPFDPTKHNPMPEVAGIP